MLGAILALLLCPAWAQDGSTAPARNIVQETRLDNLDLSLRDIQSGRPTLTSSPTIRGVPTFVNGINFGDGSFQYTASTPPNSYASSSVFIAANTTAISQTTLVACVNGSTVTITSVLTSTHTLVISGNVRVSDSGAIGKCGVLRNGQFFDGQSATKGMWTVKTAGTAVHDTWQQYWPSSIAQPAGTYSYCIACAASAGNVQFCSSTDAAASVSCFIKVQETPL